jgi:hypothetical protein
MKLFPFFLILISVSIVPILSEISAQSLRDSCTKFVHDESGSGRVATLERPARDLGNIISNLEPGDVVCIAGGTYTGRGDRGVDTIEYPVSVIGGFSPDFTKRDPWGLHQTVFTGLHNSSNFETQTRLTIDTSNFATRLKEARGEPTEHTIIVDGIIFDNGPRNYYSDSTESLIVRQGTPSHTPTPESGALTIRTGVNSTVIVQNNIAINFAPTEGVFSFFGGKSAEFTIRNNVAANNTGSGFRLGTGFTGSEIPHYNFENNISVFNQKHTPFGSFGGSGIMLESSTRVEISNSIFSYNDNFGIDNSKRSNNLVLYNNVIASNAIADYLEFDIKMGFDDIEDEAELIYDAMDNVNHSISFNINAQWGAYYSSRNVIDRNAAETEVQVINSWYNNVRAMFGWNTLAEDLRVDSPVWLPRFSLDDAFNIADLYDGKFGVHRPEAEAF